MIATFTIEEPLGRNWGPEWVRRSVSLEPGVWNGGEVRIEDEAGDAVEGGAWPESAHGDGSVRTARVVSRTSLEKGERKTFRVFEGDDRAKPPSPIRLVREEGGAVLLQSDLLEIRMPDGEFGALESEAPPAPILAIRRRGGEWAGTGTLAGLSGWRTCRATHVVEDPHRIVATVEYETESSDIYKFRLELLAHEPVIRVEEAYSGIGEGAFEIDLSQGLGARRAHMTCHRPSEPHRAPEGSAIYPIDYEEENTLWLQPFYCWNVDIGIYWGGFAEEGDYVGIIPTHASRWERPIYNRIQVVAAPGPSLRACFPLDYGTRSWMMTVIPVEEAGLGKKQILLQRLLVRLADLPLEKVLDMDLEWEGEEKIVYPHLLCTPEEATAIRKRIKQDPDYASLMLSGEHRTDPASSYFATGDEESAEKAKEVVLSFLEESVNEFFTGGFSYGPVVAIGFHRPLRTRAIDYDLVASSSAMSEEDRAICRRAFAFIAYCMTDRDYWPTREQGFSRGNINFNSDMYTALAAVAGLLTGHPRRGDWMEYVTDEMDDEFRRQVYPGNGVWSEAPTYHLHSLHYLLVAAAILQKNGFRDFSKNPALRATVDYSFKIQTPYDIRGGFHMMPTVGDTAGSFKGEGIQAIYAWMAGLAKDDPDYASRMMYAWERAGRPVEAGPRAYSLLLIDPSIEAKRPDSPLGSEQLPGYGAILRNRWDAPEETYLLFKMGYVQQHFDADEGSFHWYARGVPLSMDWGCMYQPSITQPWMHSSVSFGGKRTWDQGEVNRFVNLAGADYISGVLTTTDVQQVDDMPGTPPESSIEKAIERQVTLVHWERRIVLVRGPDYVVVRDDFDDPTGKNDTLWTVPVMAESVAIEGKRARFRGQFGMDLDVVFAAPAELKLSTREWGYRLPDIWEDQIMVHSHAPSGVSHLACLLPYRRDEAPPEITTHEGKAFRVKTEGRDDVVILSRDKVHVGVDGVEAFARAAVVSRRDDMTEIQILDGDFVRIPEMDLFFTGPVRMEVERGRIRGECDGQPRSCFLRWTPPPLEPAELTLDGRPHPVYHTFDGYLEFSVSEGEHKFEVTYPKEMAK